MTVTERFRDILKHGGKIRGHKVPVYGPGGKLDHNAIQYVAIEVADLVEMCRAFGENHPVTVSTKGARSLPPSRKIIMPADSLFEILEEAEALEKAGCFGS